MKLLAALFLTLVALTATAQDWAKEKMKDSPRHQEWVDLKSGDRTLKAFVVYPEIKDKAPVVVLIHEIMGLTDWAMLMADQLAAAGAIVIAPDFLSGMGPNGGRTKDFEDVGKAREAISGLKPEQVTSDLNAACDYALKIPAGNGKVSVGGFCWGGTQTFRFATNRADLGAAFVFYGSGPTDPEAIKRINCPVYGFYGGNDNRINATIPDSQKLMKEGGKTYEPVIYDGAGHGFMRAGDMPEASADNKKGREEGFKRLVELFKLAG
jgi:carboxymethylenebutenolidase